MNRIQLPKSPPKHRRTRTEQPARLELTLELPRAERIVEEDKASQLPRGVAMIDFYV
jgi:hypothetical protein